MFCVVTVNMTLKERISTCHGNRGKGWCEWEIEGRRRRKLGNRNEEKKEKEIN